MSVRAHGHEVAAFLLHPFHNFRRRIAKRQIGFRADSFGAKFGAVGVWIGLSCGTLVYATLLLLRFRLLVSRPPRTLEAALPLAAEHKAFCSECGRRGLTNVSLIADALVDVPFWDFWWD